jgi:DNA-directed RNA polymerase subunit N (RpoN/RPB10)
MFTCFYCGIDVGEETEEWFEKMEKVIKKHKESK